MAGNIPEPGGGVELPYGGTLYRVIAEVLIVDDTDDTLFVRVDGKDIWVHKQEVLRVLTPGEFALDNAINVLGGD